MARARRALGTRKVGHAGTLDPMATGVLVLGVGRGTRLLGHLSLTAKTYEATIRLGQATTTDDADGEVAQAPGADPADVGPRLPAVLDRYRGTIRQVPSAVSAVKVDGQRAYARVRRGESVTLEAREVTVSRLELLAARPGEVDGLAVLDVDVAVDCSSGTYIRALARDVGADLGVGGHLTALRRTRVGPFTLAHATWDGVLPPGPAPGERPDLGLVGLADAAPLAFATLEVDAGEAADVSHGRALGRPVPADPTALLHEGRLLALYRPDGGRAVPVAVLV